ncbi:MAG TPA: energy-coupling factor transporter transmembrane component T [Candidatus Hodarchaeales archaeon]|nr:energy-coupling factor transporter transmembrane component T [Candidatus Hodarchaeales archaeon]
MRLTWYSSDQIDPRIAIGILAISLGVIVFGSSISVLAVLLFQSILVYVSSQKRRFSALFLPIVFIGAILIVLHLFGVISRLDLILGFARAFILLLLFSWFFSSISPTRLTQALVWFRIPYYWAWTISSTYRFIGLFSQETSNLRQVFLMRGVPLDGNLRERIRNTPMIIIPLFYRTQMRSLQLSEALFVRNWFPTAQRTFLEPIVFLDRVNLIWILVLVSSTMVLLLSGMF